jgi:hypothetical protein
MSRRSNPPRLLNDLPLPLLGKEGNRLASFLLVAEEGVRGG